MAIRRDDFPLPDLADALTAPFFAAAARNELSIPRCDRCGRYIWYPAPACPTCGGTPSWVVVSGTATLFSWAVVRRPFLPAFSDMVPFVTALVGLAEDPTVRLATYLVDCAADALSADAPVVVDFRPLSFPTVPDRAVIVPMFRLGAHD
ncbi:MAG: Zn-ribbon domain-containing OB-fold protein [Actinomycetota bacterium]